MTDGQTGLMQQVADAGLFDTSEPIDIPLAALVGRASIEPRWQRPTHERVPTPPFQLSRLDSARFSRNTSEGDDAADVLDLVAVLLRAQGERRLQAWVGSRLNRGLSVEHVYLRLFQPAARRLGEMWLEDTCTFVDVTLAMATLHQAVRNLAPHFHRFGRAPVGSRSILLAKLSDDQHTFGLTLAGEFFRREGWTVSSLVSVRDEGLDRHLCVGAIVGFSVSRADQLPELSAAIRRVRNVGGDRLAGVIVGGPLFATEPEHAVGIDADAVGHDARQGLAEAEALVVLHGDCG